MSPPEGWSAAEALSGHRLQVWSGTAWRGHSARYAATDHSGSLKATGRYHRGVDLYPAEEVWPALYLALASQTALAEIARQLSPSTWPRLRDYRFTELAISLGAVIDCSDVAALGLAIDDLCDDRDWRVPAELALAARAAGAEAVLVPSATRWGSNLVVFPDRLRSDSSLVVIRYVEPRLVRDWQA
ncbi:MAG: RES domain-containing protein [Dehalococcoidia bacterium]